MNDIIIITKSPERVIKHLNRLNINIYNINYQKDKITLKIALKDLNKIDKYYNYKIIKEYGIKEYKSYIKKHKINIIYFLIILILIFLLTRITINIEVLTNNKDLQNHIINELDKLSLNKYSIIKTNQEITSIKETLSYNNKHLLEWINIERIGMKYIINIEPKIEKNKSEEHSYCNVISTKDALITRIITHKGVTQVSTNDSVSKDTILISGDIKYNEEIKKQICATGTVYGTTWYKINISIPLEYEKVEKLNKTRYNIILEYNNNKKNLLKQRLTDYIKEDKELINIFGTKLYLQKQIEVSKDITKLNEEELQNLIKEKIDETMSHKLKGEYKILDRKVLKKHINNSKIELEIFIVAEEQISTISIIS